MRINNIKSLIERFLNDYCIEVRDDETDDYVELMMDNHKCVDYNGHLYYLPEDLSLDESDQLLEEMIINTLLYGS